MGNFKFSRISENSQNTRAPEEGEGSELELLPLRFLHHMNMEKTTGKYQGNVIFLQLVSFN